MKFEIMGREGETFPKSDRRIYPFRFMELGDKFYVPPEWRRRVEQAACHFGRRNNKQFSVHTDPETDNVYCMRTW